MKSLKNTFLLTVTVLMTGCATNKNLYNWGAYEPQVYSYFKGDSPEKQVVELEKHLAEIKNKGDMPPPGFYAHLGMLYSKVGRDSETIGMFDLEKKTYPESSVFINNIINGFKVK